MFAAPVRARIVTTLALSADLMRFTQPARKGTQLSRLPVELLCQVLEFAAGSVRDYGLPTKTARVSRDLSVRELLAFTLSRDGQIVVSVAAGVAKAGWDGTLRWQAGQRASSLCVLPSGDIVLCQPWLNRLFVLAEDGSSVRAMTASSAAKLRYPRFVAPTCDGHVFVTQSCSYAQVMMSDGTAVRNFGPLEGCGDTWKQGVSVCLSDGSVAINDGFGSVRVFAADGVLQHKLFVPDEVQCLAADAADNVVVLSACGNVRVFCPLGTMLCQFDNVGEGRALVGVAVDDNGTILVCERSGKVWLL